MCFAMCGDRRRTTDSPSRDGFSLVELLVVISIIAVLTTILVPSLVAAKYIAGETVCAGNLRSCNVSMMMYAEDSEERYPREPTEHNPHRDLVRHLEKYDSGIINAMYCPQAPYLETFAQSPRYIPVGDVDSVADTAANRRLGNVSYVYWSFRSNKYCPTASGSENKKHWRNPTYFLPRQIMLSGIDCRPDWLGPASSASDQEERYRQCVAAPPDRTWVLSDFFRRGAPFPHARTHARGLNVVYLDGHVGLLFGRPRDNYR